MTTVSLASSFTDIGGDTSSRCADRKQDMQKKECTQKRKQRHVQEQTPKLMKTVPSSPRPKRLRQDSLKQSDVRSLEASVMCIDDVLSILATQHSYEGGVNCHVCGKLYKSRVCFIKHIWEHTVYWSMFEGVKNHDRVLSIQAAIILCSGMGSQDSDRGLSDLQSLLVTTPHSHEKKNERSNGGLRCCREIAQDSLRKEMMSSSVSSNEEDSVTVTQSRLNTGDSPQKIRGSCIRDLLERETNHYCREADSSSLSQLLLASSECTKLPVGQVSSSASQAVSSVLVQSPESSLSSFSSASSSSPPLPVLPFSSYHQQHLSSSVWKGYERPPSRDGFSISDSTDGVSFVSPVKRKRED